MVPLSNFTLQVQGLTIAFLDLSTNSPASWLWDFGDNITDTSQSPTHTYATAGQYVVKLIVTNPDGTSETLKAIVVSSGLTALLTISGMIDCNLPSALGIDELCKLNLIQQWQLYLYCLVTPNIALDKVYDETAWNPLANSLIAQLVTYDLIIQALTQSSMPASSSGSSSGVGALKTLEEGPAKAEWYNNADVAKSLLGSGAGAGIITQIKNKICALASRLRVNLPESYCGKPKKLTFIPVKAGRPCPANTNPFNIPSKG